MVIWCNFFPFWYVVPRKNLATLHGGKNGLSQLKASAKGSFGQSKTCRKDVRKLAALCTHHRNRACRWSGKHFWRKKLVKSLLISTLDKAIYYKGTFLQGSTNPLFTTQSRLETS
jgi:anti-sigma-K factor RskA